MKLERLNECHVTESESWQSTHLNVPFSYISAMKKFVLWFLTALSYVFSVEITTLCKSSLLDEGDLASSQRIMPGGSCRQNFERSFDNSADARRFCRKRFPLGVASAKTTTTHVECTWKSSAICPEDDTQIFGSCYRSVYRANYSHAAKSCSDLVYEMVYVASTEVAYWISKLFYLETHFWIENKDVPHAVLKGSAKHPLYNEEMMLTTDSEYIASSDKFHYVITTRKDVIMGIPRPGMFIKAQDSSSFPTICVKTADTSATSGSERILPYNELSHNFFSTSIKSKQGGLLSYEPSVFHEHCLKITGKGCAIPPKDSKSEIDYWTTAEQTRSHRSNYDHCHLQYDARQEFLLFQYTIQGGATVEMEQKCFAPFQPRPMCSDFARIATQGNGKGVSAVPPIIRRPLFCGDEQLDDLVRYTCDCVSEGYTTKCDPQTKKCTCASGYESIKDDRYISGYNCVPIPTTPDPCGYCKTSSYCSNINGRLGCQCLPGYEEVKGASPPNSVCKKKSCVCNNGAVCIDDVNIICGCPHGKINVIDDVNRYLTAAERTKFEKELHCVPKCKCTANAHCKGLEDKCSCKDKYVDAFSLTAEEYPRRAQITGPGQECLLKSCSDVPQNMHFVILLDNSISVARWPILVRMVNQLIVKIDPKTTTLSIVYFHHYYSTAKTFQRGQWTHKDGIDYLDYYTKHRPGGYTGIGVGLLRSYDIVMADKSSPLKSIFMIGDGEPNCHSQEMYDRFKSCRCLPYGCQAAEVPRHVQCEVECVYEITALFCTVKAAGAFYFMSHEKPADQAASQTNLKIHQKKIGLYGIAVDLINGYNFWSVPQLEDMFRRMFGKNLQLISKFQNLDDQDVEKVTKVVTEQLCRFKN